MEAQMIVRHGGSHILGLFLRINLVFSPGNGTEVTSDEIAGIHNSYGCDAIPSDKLRATPGRGEHTENKEN
jgi:hypothetical protein